MSNIMKGIRDKKALMLRARALLALLCAVLATSTALPTEAAAPSQASSHRPDGYGRLQPRRTGRGLDRPPRGGGGIPADLDPGQGEFQELDRLRVEPIPAGRRAQATPSPDWTRAQPTKSRSGPSSGTGSSPFGGPSSPPPRPRQKPSGQTKSRAARPGATISRRLRT